MKSIKIIQDRDLGINFPNPSTYENRQAARAIVYDTENNVALCHATKKNYHKLPGGGVENGEGIEAALRREVLEEIGCAIKNIKELGTIEEYRNKFNLHQTSYCFVGDLEGEKGVPNLQEGEEIEDGFETVWMSLNKAVEALEDERHIENYEGKFIRLRDLTFLKEALNLSSRF